MCRLLTALKGTYSCKEEDDESDFAGDGDGAGLLRRLQAD